jgi:hypothetical protein
MLVRQSLLIWFVSFMIIIRIPLSAQERSDTGIYIAPTTGGTLSERQFFDDNIPMEIHGANYGVVYTPQESDYIITMRISEDEDYDNPGGILKVFTISVIRTATNVAVVEYSWDYREIEEMYNWNLFLVYNALANITLTNPDITAPPPVTVPPPWRNNWLYLGFRAAPALTRYLYLTTVDYPGDNSAGFGAEAGITAEFHPFRFLSFQFDAVLSYDGFTALRIVSPEGNSRKYISDDFTGLSLMIPFLLKVPLPFEKSILSLYAGPYYTMFIGPLTKISGDTTASEKSSVYKASPLGVTAGMEIGFPAGPGELFVDLRYSRDFGETFIHKSIGPRYTQDRLTLSLGYRFGLFKRTPRVPPSPENPDPAGEETPEEETIGEEATAEETW